MIGAPGIEALLSDGRHGLGEGTVLVDVPHPATAGLYEDVLAEADAVLRPPTVDEAVEPVQWHLAEQTDFCVSPSPPRPRAIPNPPPAMSRCSLRIDIIVSYADRSCVSLVKWTTYSDMSRQPACPR
ncbi:MAG: hypothetical protein LC674_04030 [Actinobacteria bacterium]|nr:hypothetical protein [Actinomycetota bacterium]